MVCGNQRVEARQKQGVFGVFVQKSHRITSTLSKSNNQLRLKKGRPGKCRWHLILLTPHETKCRVGAFATQRFLRVEDTLHFKYLIVACLQHANNSDAH